MLIWGLDGVDQIGPIELFDRVEAVERDLRPGGWRIDLPIDGPASIAGRLLSADNPGLEIYDPDTGWRFAGFMVSRSRKITAARETLTMIGLDFQAVLAQQREWPNHLDISRFWQESHAIYPLTSAAHFLAVISLGDNALSYRQLVPTLVMGPDPAAGPTKAFVSKGDPLLDRLRLWFTGEPWTCRLRLDRDTSAIPTPFTSFRFETPERRLTEIVVSVETDTIEEITLTESAAEASHVIGMGDHDGVVNEFSRYVANDNRADGTWRNRYSETFLVRPGHDAAELADEVAKTADEKGPTDSVKVSGAQVAGYGRDVDLGDLVQVSISSGPDAIAIDVPVAASTLVGTKDGWTRTVDLGAEQLDGAALLAERLAGVGRAAARLERFL